MIMRVFHEGFSKDNFIDRKIVFPKILGGSHDPCRIPSGFCEEN